MSKTPIHPRSRRRPIILSLIAISFIILSIFFYLVIPTGTESRLIGQWNLTSVIIFGDIQGHSHNLITFQADGSWKSWAMQITTGTESEFITPPETNGWWYIADNQLYMLQMNDQPSWVNRLIRHFKTPEIHSQGNITLSADYTSFTISRKSEDDITTFNRYEGTFEEWLTAHKTLKLPTIQGN